MARILTAAVLIPLVILLLFSGLFWLVSLAAAVVAVLACWEYLALADGSGARTPRIIVLVAVAALFAINFLRPEMLMAGFSALAFLLFVIITFRSPLERVLVDTSASVFGLLYIGLALVTIPLIWAQEHGPSLLLLLFCVVWAGDTVAMYVGRSWGRRKLAPRLSPGKTWEGSLASVGGSLLVTVLLILVAQWMARHSLPGLSYDGSWLHWLVLAVVLNVAAQLGDLVESALKRGAKVKDSGSLLPGHGGVLDRIDALLLAAPVLWYAQLVQSSF
ncbi:MAG TPA: CDP-archaeol synthase [Acidobacteriaceae bacterium]|jgi:phosphatidate cytidylyltransferase